MRKFYTGLVCACAITGSVYGQSFTKITSSIITTNSLTSWGNSWIDFNNDNKLDLLVDDKDQHRLYRNDGAGVFTSVAPTNISSPDPLGFYYTAAWGDVDNDGNLDVIFGNDGDKRAFLKGNGSGGFTAVTTGPVVTDMFHSFNLSWVDYNKDGFIDLFCSNIGNTSHEKNNLYKSNGGTSFTKITSGSIVTDIDESWAHAWADYDNDGCPDLFVANVNSDWLYRNNCDGTFTKITTGAIVSDGKNSQSASWGDYNNDGFIDLFVSVWGDHCLLYKNNGDGTFTKVVGSAFDNNTDQCTGSGWGDYDNDGFLDMFVCCWTTAGTSHNRLYHNNGDGTFTEITTSPLTATAHASNGCTWADYDNDGFQDLYVTNKSTNNELFHNDGNTNSWINIKLVGIASNRAAIGAKVRIKATIGGTPVWQMREIGGMSGQFSQSGMNAAFGFGNATMLDSVKIEWPSGATCVFTNMPVNKFIVINEDCTTHPVAVKDVNNVFSGSVSAYPNPFARDTKIVYNISNATDVSLTVTDITGKQVIQISNPHQVPGKYETIITGQQLNANGIYIYTLKAGDQIFTGKIIYDGK